MNASGSSPARVQRAPHLYIYRNWSRGRRGTSLQVPRSLAATHRRTRDGPRSRPHRQRALDPGERAAAPSRRRHRLFHPARRPLSRVDAWPGAASRHRSDRIGATGQQQGGSKPAGGGPQRVSSQPCAAGAFEWREAPALIARRRRLLGPRNRRHCGACTAIELRLQRSRGARGGRAGARRLSRQAQFQARRPSAASQRDATRTTGRRSQLWRHQRAEAHGDGARSGVERGGGGRVPPAGSGIPRRGRAPRLRAATSREMVPAAPPPRLSVSSPHPRDARTQAGQRVHQEAAHTSEPAGGQVSALHVLQADARVPRWPPSPGEALHPRVSGGASGSWRWGSPHAQSSLVRCRRPRRPRASPCLRRPRPLPPPSNASPPKWELGRTLVRAVSPVGAGTRDTTGEAGLRQVRTVYGMAVRLGASRGRSSESCDS